MSDLKEYPMLKKFSIEKVYKDSDHPMSKHVTGDCSLFVTTSTGGMISADLFFETYITSKFYMEYNGEYDGYNNE